jgi:hypothetical protein
MARQAARQASRGVGICPETIPGRWMDARSRFSACWVPGQRTGILADFQVDSWAHQGPHYSWFSGATWPCVGLLGGGGSVSSPFQVDWNGTSISLPHAGHVDRRPPNWSLTSSRLPHLAQTNLIAIDSLPSPLSRCTYQFIISSFDVNARPRSRNPDSGLHCLARASIWGGRCDGSGENGRSHRLRAPRHVGSGRRMKR